MLQKTKKNFLYFSSQDFPFKFLILIFFFSPITLAKVSWILFSICCPSERSFDDKKKMFKDLIWTTENHRAVLLLFSLP